MSGRDLAGRPLVDVGSPSACCGCRYRWPPDREGGTPSALVGGLALALHAVRLWRRRVEHLRFRCATGSARRGFGDQSGTQCGRRRVRPADDSAPPASHGDGKAIESFVEHWNSDSAPIAWTATAEEIIDKVRTITSRMEALLRATEIDDGACHAA